MGNSHEPKQLNDGNYPSTKNSTESHLKTCVNDTFSCKAKAVVVVVLVFNVFTSSYLMAFENTAVSK